MATVLGTWDVRMKTPIGSIDVVYTFTDDRSGGGLTGSAASANEVVPLHEIDVRPEPGGERVTWRQSVTRPMRLNLAFDVLVSGTELNGHSRAGRLPRSTVTGVRRGAQDVV